VKDWVAPLFNHNGRPFSITKRQHRLSFCHIRVKHTRLCALARRAPALALEDRSKVRLQQVRRLPDEWGNWLPPRTAQLPRRRPLPFPSPRLDEPTTKNLERRLVARTASARSVFPLITAANIARFVAIIVIAANRTSAWVLGGVVFVAVALAVMLGLLWPDRPSAPDAMRTLLADALRTIRTTACWPRASEL
jgi:hypothetical protein